ncbi:hypothetical protein AAE478_004081 [Parahypoxylon ruwenzoriense]
MASAIEDTVVSVSDPMPCGYVFVQKGNTYITANCRKETYTKGKIVYIVQDLKHRQVGIHVPKTVFMGVLKSHHETKDLRARVVQRRDRKMEADFRHSILSQFPQIPSNELPKVVSQAMKKGSGRVGRTGKLDIAEKTRLAVHAHVRHTHTEYDKLLRNGVPREQARNQIREMVDKMMKTWGWLSKPAMKYSAETHGDGKKSAKAKSNLRRSGNSRSGALKEKKMPMSATASQRHVDELDYAGPSPPQDEDEPMGGIDDVDDENDMDWNPE